MKKTNIEFCDWGSKEVIKFTVPKSVANAIKIIIKVLAEENENVIWSTHRLDD